CCCQAEDGIRDRNVTGVQTCALPIFIRRISAAKCPPKSFAIGKIYIEYFSFTSSGLGSRAPYQSDSTERDSRVRFRNIPKGNATFPVRSEERRVGKEGRSCGMSEH